jgi:cellulose biosynthesis protein BcsQ
MKAYIVYSGKGGVGKTTTTANIAKYMSSNGKRVFIIDADINTPSMHTVFSTPTPSDTLRIASLGYNGGGMIYMQGSMIRQYMRDSVKAAKEFNADVILIDTPPSISDVHMQLLKSMTVSGILFVTQPSAISMSDVTRTARFFLQHKIPLVGIVENMSQGEEVTYPYELIAKVSFDKSFNHNIVYSANMKQYAMIADRLVEGENLQLMKRQLTHDIFSDKPNIEELTGGLYKDDDVVREDYEPTFGYNVTFKKFINFATWDFVRHIINYNLPASDGYLYEPAARLREMCEPFIEDEEAYFMVVKPPCTEITLLRGEIGKCSLQLGNPSYYGLPRLLYHTKQGTVTLFRHEVSHVTSQQLQLYIKEGYIPIDDGRYMPSEELCETIDNTFGMDKDWRTILQSHLKHVTT